ncbi:DUF397 domain-containing protein [Amycolatopsis sp. CA-230715]|uniref:DUF397 domain-containing protein n=1 Tax=Amycolatopsis sp. CA-230715 TaxID=2745196 RepID=UPI001C03345A|nr:DUF397 domain-containing protein [Amycolatopsis sp. CA-230715]QWF78680.1 hypothetical protein HUW46_02078 [Amycolatopsis sp. CA-230715]
MTTSPPRFADHEFRKAARSEPKQNCVRVARRDGWVEVRDDKLQGRPEYATRALRLTEADFDDYQMAVREGRQQVGHSLETVRRDSDGMYVFRHRDVPSIELEFTFDEVNAFLDGVVKGEFDLSAYAAA